MQLACNNCGHLVYTVGFHLFEFAFKLMDRTQTNSLEYLEGTLYVGTTSLLEKRRDGRPPTT
jgi:hypothetical protein